jgi:thioredoxin-related protein
VIQYADLATSQKSLLATLQKADTNERMYRYFIETFDFFLNDPLSSMREEQWIEPVWKQMLKSRWCTTADSAKVVFFLKMAAKNRVGTTATDLDYITIEGQKGKLSEIEADLLLVYFYIPGCEQCIRTREWIEEDTAYQEIHKAGVLKVLAFYPEKDMSKFLTYRNSVPLSWINSRDPDGQSQLEEQEKYQMRGAPTMYLLDKNKKIILKDAREDLLFNEFAKARDAYLKK